MRMSITRTIIEFLRFTVVSFFSLPGTMLAILTLLTVTVRVAHGGSTVCPDALLNHPWAADLVRASEYVSWPDGPWQGDHGTFETVKTCDLPFPDDTRMRVYANGNKTYIVAFRPTQPDGYLIHVNRRLVPCRFLDSTPSCGFVLEKVQDAFLRMWDQCRDVVDLLRGQEVYVSGHSLGSTLMLFASAKLWVDLDTPPRLALGFAGPFIGDTEYTSKIQDAIPHLANTTIWNVQTMDRSDPTLFDGTILGYNVDWGVEPRIVVDDQILCNLLIDPLPIGQGAGQTYGMHDLRQYAHGFGIEIP